MARLWQCGFEWATTSVFSTVVGALSVSAARSRTGAYSLYASTGSIYGQVALPSAITEIFIRLWINPDTVSATSARNCFLWLLDDIGTFQLSFRLNGTTRVVEVLRGDASGILLASSVTVVPLDVWTGLFIRATIADAGGIVQVRFGSSTAANDINFAGDTRNGGDANVGVVNVGNYSNIGMAIYHDDLAINDTSGTLNNSWVADGGIYGLSPTGAGTYAVWTPSAGANWQCVDDVPLNDADYVSTSAPANKDSYALANCPGVGKVAAASYWLRARKEAAGDAHQVRRLFRIGGVNYAGTDRVLSTDFGSLGEILETSPATNLPWSTGELDASEIGQECR